MSLSLEPHLDDIGGSLFISEFCFIFAASVSQRTIGISINEYTRLSAFLIIRMTGPVIAEVRRDSNAPTRRNYLVLSKWRDICSLSDVSSALFISTAAYQVVGS
jgi:hypothetical protein